MGAKTISSISISGGILACGLFLTLISIFGFVSAHLQHSRLLAIYAVILGILFIIQFSVSVAALAINSQQQESILQSAWETLSVESKEDVMSQFDCCSFQNVSAPITDPLGPGQACTQEQIDGGACYPKLADKINKALKGSGGVGLFFSFTEIIGVVMAYLLWKNPPYK